MYHSQTNYATFWQRLLALLIDSVVLTILIFILLLIVNVGYPKASVYDPQTRGMVTTISAEAFIAILIVFLVVPYLYHALFESSHSQATPGKMALGIYLTTTRGNEVDLPTATMRYVVRVFLSGWLFYLGYWMMFFTARRQCLHDLLAGTIVVRNPGEHDIQRQRAHAFDPGITAHEDYWDGSQWVKRPIGPPQLPRS